MREGNTYHSCKVYVDGYLIGYRPFVYGYDRAYLQTAHSILQEGGFYPETNERINGMSKDFYQFLNDLKDNKHNFRIAF